MSWRMVDYRESVEMVGGLVPTDGWSNVGRRERPWRDRPLFLTGYGGGDPAKPPLELGGGLRVPSRYSVPRRATAGMLLPPSAD